jgi:hypothetical protein
MEARAVGDGVELPCHLDGDESALLVQDPAFVPTRISQPGAASDHELPATGWAFTLGCGAFPTLYRPGAAGRVPVMGFAGLRLAWLPMFDPK